MSDTTVTTEAPSALPADAPESFDSPTSAANYFASLLEKREKPEPAAERAEPATADHELSGEDNAAQAEEPATGETQEDAPSEKTPRELPRSWTKDRAEVWNRLDPDAQDILLEQDRKASAEVRKVQNDAAETRKAAEAERVKWEQATKQRESLNPAKLEYHGLLQEQARAFPNIKSLQDLETLAGEAMRLWETDPLRAGQISAYLKTWDVHQQRLFDAKAKVDAAERFEADEAKTKRNTYQAEQRVRLTEFVPEFADQKKYQAAWERAMPELAKLGLPQQELDRLSNTEEGAKILFSAAFQKLISDSQKLADIQKASQTAKVAPVPAVQRPGTKQPSGNAPTERIAALTRQLNETGDLRIAQQLRAAQVSTRTRRSG